MMITKRDSFTALGYIVVFVAYIVIAGVGILVGVFGPPYQESLYQTAYNCSGPTTTPQMPAIAPCAGGIQMNVNTTFWRSRLSGMSQMNEEVLLFVTPANRLTTGVTHAVDVGIRVEGRNPEDNSWTIITNSTRTRTFVCSEGASWCRSQVIVHLTYIGYTDFVFRVDFQGSVGSNQFVGDVLFQFQYRNAEATSIEMWFRYAFLVATIIVFCYYLYLLWPFKWIDHLVEQKWMVLVLILLLLFNNPVYPVEMMVNGWVFPFVNVLFEVSFLSGLLLFWLVNLDSIRYPLANDRPFLRFYLPKLIVVGVIWLFVLIVFAWETLQQLGDPTYQSLNDLPGFVFVFVVMILLVVVYVFWILFILFRTCNVVVKQRTVRRSYVFFGVLTLLTIGTMIFGLLFGAFGPYRDNAAELLTFFSLLNAYVWALAIMLSPSKRASPSGDNTYQMETDESGHEMSAANTAGAPAGKRGSASDNAEFHDVSLNDTD